MRKTPLRQIVGRWFLAATTVSCFGFAQAQSGPKGPAKHPGPPHDPNAATSEEAAAAIQHAYDGISRTSILQNGDAADGPESVNTVESASRTAYQEALSCYQANDYVGAREQAMASADLSRAAEELMMSREAFPGGTGVPAPPSAAEEHDRAARDLENLNYRLPGVKRRLTESGTFSAATVAQLQSLLSQSGRLEQRAQDLLLHGQTVRAGHVARAGDALTHAAEHIQNRYLLAADIIPTPVDSPPGQGRHPAPQPDPEKGPHR